METKKKRNYNSFIFKKCPRKKAKRKETKMKSSKT